MSAIETYSKKTADLYETIEREGGKLHTIIYHWVGLSPGEFSVVDVDRDFPLDPTSGKATWLQRLDRIQMLEAMVENGELMRVGNRRGVYRPTQMECKPMSFEEVSGEPVEIFWPFGIHQFVNLFPGNIATLGGMKNSGKTAFLLNLAKFNRERMDVHYFNSEQGEEEMFARLNLFEDMTMSDWAKVKFYERSSNFPEVIKPGCGKLNIIDFLEVHDDFYAIGGLIRDIFDALDGALAVIAIQQNPNTEDPIGGRRSTEKSRLHLKMSSSNDIEIKVGKNWAIPGVNPNGLVCSYKLRGGWDFQAQPTHDDKSKIWGRRPKEG